MPAPFLLAPFPFEARTAISWPMTDPALAQAAQAAEAALAAGTGDAYDCMIAALGRADRADHTGAQALFDRALALEPGNPAVLSGLAKWYRTEGRLSEAVRACDMAIAVAPEYPDAWIERGAAYAAGGSSAVARDSFARAAALAPANPIAHAGFAALAARDGALDDARRAALHALRLDPASLVAAGTLATVALEQGDAQAAREVLGPALARTSGGPDRPQALTVMATALERLGDHDAAFALYAQANAEFAALHERSVPGQLPGLKFVEAILDGLSAVDPRHWQSDASAPAADGPSHIFVTGYPRSGNTLVENILASLPGVAALEERPTLGATDRRFLAGDERAIAAGIAAFAQLADSELKPLRQAYWDKVNSAGVPQGAPHFVDMDPMKGLHLPFIAKLFPAARVVIMRRDPRDVVWSCFKTPFAPTTGTMEFTTLERAARHYDAMMRLIALALDRLPMNALQLDYHRLVRDFDATTRALCGFTGIPWSEAVRRFDKTAATRGVSTASAGQVRKGLYDGSGQWQPYARQLEPVLPILQPWIERFGYG